MRITLGARAEHGFDQPLGLLSDCHRRIESFLGMMIRVVERSGSGRKPLVTEERQALEAALQYFRTAAPRHTQDEEVSLFPRMRESNNPEAHAALARMEALEADHQHADVMHEEAHQLCRRWLDGAAVEPAEFQRLHRLLHDLREMYVRHISLEDSELFPLAARVLDSGQLARIGAEMAERRGLHTHGQKS
jgi:hemerythrin-like domain-containing protein